MDMNQIMQQARQMQAQLSEAQDRLPDVKVKGSAGNGMVEVTASADMKIHDVRINPQVIDPEDVEMLQDLILVAVNDALDNASEAANIQLGSVTNGLNIPGLF